MLAQRMKFIPNTIKFGEDLTKRHGKPQLLVCPPPPFSQTSANGTSRKFCEYINFRVPLTGNLLPNF